MSFTLASQDIAVATTGDGRTVARFGHDHPLVAIDAAGTRSPRLADGCCGHLAQAVADCAVVICTAIGQGAARHLAQAGVPIAIVPEDTLVESAVQRYRAGTLEIGGKPSACDHGHDHGAHGGTCQRGQA